MYRFPKDFLWGVATASHQIEGDVVNDWTQWEKKTAVRNSKKGVRPAIKELEGEASNPENYFSTYKYCPESYKYWEKDVEAIKELGLNAYRLSVEWSRIQPERDTFSREGIEYYRNVLRELKRNNIKVVLTCWHWSLPLWIEKEKSLLSKNIYTYFKKYVEYLYDNLGEYVDYWITINEPEAFVFGYFRGIWPPGGKNLFNYLKVFFIVLPRMHMLAYDLIKGKDKSTKVSFAKNCLYVTPYNRGPINVLIAKVVNWYAVYSFVDIVKKKMDFFGLNFYFHTKVGIRGIRNDNDRVNDLGWWMDPSKLYNIIKIAHNRYKLPIIITENGLADYRDNDREWWIKESVSAMQKAREDGCNVFGYLHWSLLDNFEWDKGYWPRFGLVSINPDTKERVIKRSGWYYSKIAKNNGII